MAAEPSDVLFRDRDVCILRPDSPRGVLIFTGLNSKDICREGLYSHNELQRRKPEIGLRSRQHIDPNHDDLIFFRAPYTADTSTFESSYDGNTLQQMLISRGAVAVIRVDPANTFVYSSEIRASAGATYDYLLASRIPMLEYLRRIDGHIRIGYTPGYMPVSNLIDYSKSLVPYGALVSFPRSTIPVERNAEVVVRIPYLPREWIVECLVSAESSLMPPTKAPPAVTPSFFSTASWLPSSSSKVSTERFVEEDLMMGGGKRIVRKTRRRLQKKRGRTVKKQRHRRRQ